MVCSGARGERERVTGVVMAMVPERSKPPLHNFDLPCLKWGSQRHLRCMKLSGSTSDKESKNGNTVSICTTDRHRNNRSPPSKFVATRNFDVRRFKRPEPRVDDDGDGGVEEGIEAVRVKIMFDLKTAADKMKDTILKKEASCEDDEEDVHEHDEEEEEEEQQQQQQCPNPAPVAVSTAVVETEPEVRPWNLRTRRAACKAPIGVNSVTDKGMGIEEKKLSNNSPSRSDGPKSPGMRAEKREREKEKEKGRAKFAVRLSRGEIEEDFMAMVGHRPARRPKKRPRIVQGQLDSLFPGLWLTEVTADMYKVPEIPDNGKR